MRDRFIGRFLARRLAALALLLPVSALAFPSAAAADNRHLVLNYEIRVGGIKTFNITYDALLKPASYDMKVVLQGKGVLDWWFSWTMTAFSEGRFTSGTVVPVRAGADSSWRGKQRLTRINYQGNGLPRVEIKPLPEDDDREIVTSDLRIGARDLAGTVLAALTRIGAANRCDVREPVFDGRRRYNLVLTHLGRDELLPNEYSPFGGSALRCSVKIERIAGYRRDQSRSRWRSDDTATIWLARPFDGALPVPVRMEMETLLGGFRAHLVDATLKSGDSLRRLAAAP